MKIHMPRAIQWFSYFGQDARVQYVNEQMHSVHFSRSFRDIEETSLSAPLLAIYSSGVKALCFIFSLRDIVDYKKMVCKKQKPGNGNYLSVLGNCSIVSLEQINGISIFDV